jgi:hypothetical protein
MDPNPAAEELPALYRSVLDRVGQLEADGQRELARLVRAEAIRIYSKSWNLRAKRDLEALLRRHAVAIVTQRTPARAFRRRIFRTA